MKLLKNTYNVKARFYASFVHFTFLHIPYFTHCSHHTQGVVMQILRLLIETLGIFYFVYVCALSLVIQLRRVKYNFDLVILCMSMQNKSPHAEKTSR